MSNHIDRICGYNIHKINHENRSDAQIERSAIPQDTQFGSGKIDVSVSDSDTAAIVTFTTVASGNFVTLSIEQTAGTDVLFTEAVSAEGASIIKVVTPAIDLGLEKIIVVDVVVTNPDGQSATLEKRFYYTDLSGEAQTGTLTISFVKGLNMVSLPVQPETPLTAKTFAEQIGDTTLLIRYRMVIVK